MNYGYFHDHYISNVNDDTIKFIYTQSNEIFITSIKIRYDFLNDLCKQKLQTKYRLLKFKQDLFK